MGENQIHEGEVQEFGTSGSGTTKIKIGGQWFYSGNVDTSGIAFGDRISIEWKPFTPQAKPGSNRPPPTLKMIQNWGKLAQLAAPIGDRGPQRVNPAALPKHLQHSPQTPGQLQQPTPEQLYGKPQGSIMDADYIRLISNVMAALVGANKIETPADIRLWYGALREAVTGETPATTPEFDDNIPY